MDIFTINLDSRPDRWNRVMAIQRAHPWARFHRLPAVPIPMFPVAACTASHQLAVLMACAEGLSSITVAEDDLEPTTYFDQWPSVVAKAEALGLDYVIGAVATSEDHTPTTYTGSDENGAARHTVGNVMLVEARNGRGTHLITYFSSAYEKILGLQFGSPIDAAIGRHPQLRGGFAFPFVAIQGDGYSDLAVRQYDTPKLYEGAARRWAERLGVTLNGGLAEMLKPTTPTGDGLETVCRLSPRDLMMGRHRRRVAFAASDLLEQNDGE